MNKNVKYLLITFFIITCSIPNLGAKEKSLVSKQSIAVIEFTNNNVQKSYAKIVRNSIEISLFNSDIFRLVDREQMQKIARRTGLSLSSSASPTTLIKLGKKLSTEYLVSGSIAKLDDYKLTIRVISVKEGSVLTAYSKFFSSANDIDYAVEKITDKIKADISRYIKTGQVRSPFFEQHNLYLGLRLNYLVPLSKLDNVINSGPGFTLISEVDNVLYDNLFIGLNFGYYKFTGKNNSSDKATFIPILFSAGYRHYFSKNFYLKPELSAGINIISLVRANNGSFTIEENKERKAHEPMLKAGVSFGIKPGYDLSLELGGECGTIIEQDGSIRFYNLFMGVLAVY